MRIILLSFAVLLLISTIFAAPGVTPTNKQTCNECTLDYTPICAGPPGTTNDREKKSFGNICVMEKYNCEKDEKLVKLDDGECPGGKSVRLQ